MVPKKRRKKTVRGERERNNLKEKLATAALLLHRISQTFQNPPLTPGRGEHTHTHTKEKKHKSKRSASNSLEQHPLMP